MLTEICAEIKNYFCYSRDKHAGKFKIENGTLIPQLDFVTDYFAIFGSRKNNGVHKVVDNDLVDEEEFTGSVWIMSLPADFLALVKEIEDWQKQYGAVDSHAMSPFNSESFGGYSYSKSGGAAEASGSVSPNSWQTTYANRLNLYRRVRLH